MMSVCEEDGASAFGFSPPTPQGPGLGPGLAQGQRLGPRLAAGQGLTHRQGLAPGQGLGQGPGPGLKPRPAQGPGLGRDFLWVDMTGVGVGAGRGSSPCLGCDLEVVSRVVCQLGLRGRCATVRDFQLTFVR